MVMMDSLEKARRKRMVDCAVQFQNVNAEDLMPYLKCLPRPQKEKILCKQRLDGALAAAQMLGMALVKVDNWFEQLIPALRELNQNELADLLDDPPEDKRLENHRDVGLQSHQEKKGKFSPNQEKNLHQSEAGQSTLPRPSTSSGQSLKVTLQTPYSQLSALILHVLRRLDVLSPATGNDWTGLAGQLGFSIDSVNRFRSQQGSPTEALLLEWSNEGAATLEKLINALHDMHREDICQQLEELLGLRLELRNNQDGNTAEPRPTVSVSSRPLTEQDQQSELAARPQVTDTAPNQPAVDTEVEEEAKLVAPAPRPQPEAVPSHAEESGEDVATESENAAKKESDTSPKPQNSQSTETSKADASIVKHPEAEKVEVPSAHISCKDSQPPVNNLNRKHVESDHANCQVKTQLSDDPETCSDNNPGDGYSTGYIHVESNVCDCYHSLKTDDELDRDVSLQMSEESVPTIVPVASLDAGTSGASAGDDPTSSSSQESSSATTALSASATSVAPATVGQAVKKDSCDGFAPTVKILTSSQGAPVRQASGDSKYHLEQFQVPSVDGAFPEAAWMRATAFKSTSNPEASSSIRQVRKPVKQQQLCDAKPVADQVGPKPSQPDKDSQDPAPKPSHLNQQKIGESQKKQASSAVDSQHQHHAQTKSPPTPLAPHEEDGSGGNPELSGSEKQEASTETQCDPPPIPQLVESTQLLPSTTNTPSALQASPQRTQEVDSTGCLEESGAKSPEASVPLRQEASLPDQDSIQPPHALADNTEDQGGDSQEPGAEDENTDATTESQGRGALVGLALAVPVVLSLAAALTGGDILSNVL
ncbi:neurofilament heavy polypeptide-like [Patiria miniata]|uniref:Death domain-containing protein n=1 Tax=Patiria miniata TaxID=46514 RepID=A0A913Z720_PATMI|nr:neurofilament heavy polypeptide-like [Patiria miniata]XP_038046624.1 neurofilament heavy polypeptide-like [Patiria miniata]XP_038046625.1 neurofilament heavy polypeptide-like [Patiria miniata]